MNPEARRLCRVAERVEDLIGLVDELLARPEWPVPLALTHQLRAIEPELVAFRRSLPPLREERVA